MNQGIRLSKTPYIALLNNDTWLMPEWDQSFIDKIEELKADMVGPHFYEGPFKENIEDIDSQDPKILQKPRSVSVSIDVVQVHDNFHNTVNNEYHHLQ